jgi:ribosomal protein S18 acetylase RimI-like enzyme
VIRETRAEDWQLYRDVRLRALAEAPYAFLTRYDEAVARPDGAWQEAAGPRDRSVTFVADADGRFDGMVAGFVDDDPRVVFLVAMWVDPVARGTGLAARLVERVVDWAREREADCVRLAVEPGNDRAARLYERCGFVRVDGDVSFPWDAPETLAYERRL